jgi:hypothetical protein
MVLKKYNPLYKVYKTMLGGTKDLTIIVLTSADPTAEGNATSFSHNIRQFAVDDASDYEVAMISLDWPSNNTSTYVSCNLVGFTRVGSQMTNTLFRIPPTNIALHSHYAQNQSIVQWMPLAASSFTVAQVALTESTGTLLPAPSGSQTVLTIAIRKVNTSN